MNMCPVFHHTARQKVTLPLSIRSSLQAFEKGGLKGVEGVQGDLGHDHTLSPSMTTSLIFDEQLNTFLFDTALCQYSWQAL